MFVERLVWWAYFRGGFFSERLLIGGGGGVGAFQNVLGLTVNRPC